MALNLRSLIARLNTTCRGAMEGAAGLCMSRGHYEVEVEHLLVKLLEVENSDIHRILRQFEIAPEALERIKVCRAMLEEKLVNKEVMYGTNTGIGEFSEEVFVNLAQHIAGGGGVGTEADG